MTTRPSAAARSPFLAVLGLVLALVVSGCTGDSGGGDSDGGSDGPDPQDTATALASGLTARDLSKVSFTSETATTAQASYDRVAQELADEKLRVDTGGVQQDGSTATATLH